MNPILNSRVRRLQRLKAHDGICGVVREAFMPSGGQVAGQSWMAGIETPESNPDVKLNSRVIRGALFPDGAL